MMSWTPAVHFAMGLLIRSEMNAPPKPITREKPSRPVTLRPLADKNRFKPKTLTP